MENIFKTGVSEDMLKEYVAYMQENIFKTGINELDEVLGGGLVTGSINVFAMPSGHGNTRLTDIIRVNGIGDYTLSALEDEMNLYQVALMKKAFSEGLGGDRRYVIIIEDINNFAKQIEMSLEDISIGCKTYNHTIITQGYLTKENIDNLREGKSSINLDWNKSLFAIADNIFIGHEDFNRGSGEITLHCIKAYHGVISEQPLKINLNKYKGLN